MKNLKLFDIRWTSHTAGPSPYGNNDRTELFLMGCQKAQNGNACKGCFNPKLWSVKENARSLNPEEMAKHISEHAPNKFLTIVGGEPLDQMEGLAYLCASLKARGFHIIVFTHYLMKDVVEMPESEMLLTNIDILIDGEYREEERIYDESRPDGLHNAVGSGNQVIWNLHDWNKHGCMDDIEGIPAREILQLTVTEKGDLHYLVKKKDTDSVTVAV